MAASSEMRFHADLHIHSKYSRATSRDLDLEHLSMWACRKGLAVVGTGDFTHPAWRAELKQKLVPAEPGLFRLRPEIERDIERSLPPACQAQTRFMLTVEISTIYKKAERTRKVHHCLFAPDFDTADRISAALARIGNIASDGRPILGLDSRNLLEITLDSDPGAYLIPAHIWTPWFAALGSQSGFDSIEACYGDLTPHIFAVETGLSSDPSMNWRLSQLDRYRLVSNSDAHSPAKLGREATTFDTDIDYFAIRRALETGHGYVGTVEFFPEEGKYHSDGHRKCNVRQSPAETLANGGRCLVCGDPTTVGVLHRVEALADRGEDDVRPPSTAGEVSSLVPLAEMISEIASSGVHSKTVERSYDRLVSTLGAELDILEAVPVEDIARNASPLLAEAITRLRAGQVIREAGYDGEYGVIRLFDDSELRRRTAGDLLFDAHASAKGRKKTPASAPAPAVPAPAVSTPAPGASAPAVSAPPVLAPRARSGTHASLLSIFVAEDSAILAALDEDQRAAAEVADGPMLIVAGPGSGKTRTLTHRMAHMIAERGVPPSACLAITFTRRAAAEMRARLAALLSSRMPGCAEHVPIHTFHSLGLTILRDHAAAAGVHPDFRVAGEAEQLEVLMGALAMSEGRASTMLRAISRAKRTSGAPASSAGAIEAAPTPDVVDAMAAYQRALRARQCVDFDDLVGLAVKALASKKRVAAACRERYRWISVDEFQDVDEQQYRLLTLLAPGGTGADDGAGARANLCVIGDPNQAIYGFRGADASCFERFNQDYAGAPCVRLTRNYRSTGTIVAASSQVIASSSSSSLTQERPIGDIVREMHERITIHVAPSDRAEAELVVRTIENLMGGHDLFTLDSGRFTLFTVSSRSNRTDSFDGPGGSGPNGSAAGAPAEFGFADFAVLYRTDAQSAALREAFARSGIPFGKHSHDLLADQAVVRAVLDVWRDRCGNTSDQQLSLADSLRSAAAAATLSIPADTSEAGAADSAGRGAASDIAARELALQQLLRVASECDGDAARFEDALTLTTEADFWDPRADRVSLLTMHAAKGLEFPVVFIIGLEDGVVPLYWSQLDEATKAEERRLFYVGMTRAKDRLFLTRALQRLWRGRVRELPASAFLNDIEQELVKHQQMPAPRPRVEDRQLKLL